MTSVYYEWWWGRCLLVVKVQNLCPPSHFPKPSSGPEWSLCKADFGPQALRLCLTPLIQSLKVSVNASKLASHIVFQKHAIINPPKETNSSVTWINWGEASQTTSAYSCNFSPLRITGSLRHLREQSTIEGFTCRWIRPQNVRLAVSVIQIYDMFLLFFWL